MNPGATTRFVTSSLRRPSSGVVLTAAMTLPVMPHVLIREVEKLRIMRIANGKMIAEIGGEVRNAAIGAL